MTKTHLIYLTAIIAMVSVLMGCGGGGGSHVANREGSATGDLSKASGQVAAVVFVQQWSEILWGVMSTQTGTHTPAQSGPDDNGDGSWTSTFLTADGTTGTIITYGDGTATISVVRPNGATQTVTQSAPAFDGSKTGMDWVVTSSDGLRVTYTSVVDDQGTWWDVADDTTCLTGTSTLPGGVTQTFVVTTIPGTTTVRSEQSDGSTFTLSVPLNPVDFMPDFSQDSTGTYVSRNFNISFTLTHPPADAGPLRWSVMSSDLGNQITGVFSLKSDFSGYGQLEETVGGVQKPNAILTWNRSGDSQVELVVGQSRQTQPAGAAVDYLQHRWQTLAALMAPAPGPNLSGLACAVKSRQWRPS